jgi:hypothetical protein
LFFSASPPERDREALRHQPSSGVAAFEGAGDRRPDLARARRAVAALSVGRYRRFWTESFDKMGAYLAELKAKEKRK